jgi:hypothetical protein
MVLDCDMWCNWNLPRGIFNCILEKNQMNIYLNKLDIPTYLLRLDTYLLIYISNENLCIYLFTYLGRSVGKKVGGL